jgi:hypothetical protein
MELRKKDQQLKYFSGLILSCGAVLLIVSKVYQFFTASLGHDQTAYLFEAQRMIGGAEPYGPHLAETNPPMIIWFSAIPVFLARWAHGSDILWLQLLVTAMIFASAVWCVNIVRRGAAINGPVAAGLLGFAILEIELRVGIQDYGQREHLVIILLLPYLLAVATGAVARISLTERCALGVAAGIAIWFKPQDVLILIALELFLSLRTRSLRRLFSAEFLALILTSSFVLLMVRLLTPLYFKNTLPLLFDTYWALGTSNAFVLVFSQRRYLAFVFAMILGLLFLRGFMRGLSATVALLVCSLAASCVFDIQHVVWDYHAYPHRALMQVALAYMLIDLLYPALTALLSDAPMVRRIMLISATVTAVLLCVIAIRPRMAFTAVPREDNQLNRFYAQTSPSTTVYVLSTAVRPLSEAHQHGLNWGGRFAHLWMMPAIVQNELGPVGYPAPFTRLSPERVTELATLQRSETAEDLNYWHPSIVLVEHCDPKHFCQGIDGKDFDMLAWFLQGPQFAAVWSHYQRQPGLDDFDVYKFVP